MKFGVISWIRRKRFQRSLLKYMCQEVRNDCATILGKIKVGALENTDISCYLRHLPIRDRHDDYPESVLKLTDRCVQDMYDYSVKMGFIDNTVSKEEFIRDFWSIQLAKKNKK